MDWESEIQKTYAEEIAELDRLCEHRILDKIGAAYFAHGMARCNRPIATVKDGKVLLDNWADENLREAIARHMERHESIIQLCQDALKSL